MSSGSPFSGDDRRRDARLAANARGLILGAGFVVPCLIVDISRSGARVRTERALPAEANLQLVEMEKGLVHDARSAWRQGMEVGLQLSSTADLRRLVPTRLATARQAWLRAGGR
jgi:hypothetical protein